MRIVRHLTALVVLAAVLTACAETPAQHAARMKVEAASAHAGRAGDTHCTSNPRVFFAEGPAATVFICLVKVGGGQCDRYVVHQGNLRMQARDVDCILPGGT